MLIIKVLGVLLLLRMAQASVTVERRSVTLTEKNTARLIFVLTLAVAIMIIIKGG